MKFTLPFTQLGISDIARAGGKNASLGEMYNALASLGVRIPNGFATTAEAFRRFMAHNHLEEPVRALLKDWNGSDIDALNRISGDLRGMVLQGTFPSEVRDDIITAFNHLSDGKDISVAVRSSATAEDLPEASFAGLHDSFLNIRGEQHVLLAIRRCFASLYNARAIQYRREHGFESDTLALSAGVQLMVNAGEAASGVCFTLDPESGFRDVVVLTSSWGLGENIVQGRVVPDEFHIYKPFLGKAKQPIISSRMGSKTLTMRYASGSSLSDEPGSTVVNDSTPASMRNQFSLSREEVLQLAAWAVKIEEHYAKPMDIEWAKDGSTGELFIVQARPETVHASVHTPRLITYDFTTSQQALVTGSSIGSGIRTGIARVLHSPEQAGSLKRGEILVTGSTNPDWDPILKEAGAIITTRGGRTSHAAIVARETGAIAIVGAEGATELIHDGEPLTIDCSRGKTGRVYRGILPWTEHVLDFAQLEKPRTSVMLILADPDRAYTYSLYPSDGVGLLRMEFAITHAVRVHPMALIKSEKIEEKNIKEEIDRITNGYASGAEYFTDKLSQAVGTVAAAFYPRPVIVRMSDFKSNEYSGLLGGSYFEEKEENPMIGFRGASRYYDERYREGFRLECRAIRTVREDMGFANVKLMIPFCRTPEEGRKVLDIMAEEGLVRGRNGLEVYVMAEIPSNVILAEQFAEVFDGFSIGSNDLTQLVLGVDRDSGLLAHLFDEGNEAVRKMIAEVIAAAKRSSVKVGLCGQAPSDKPEFAKFLVELGIDSISFNPDALVAGIRNVLQAERK